MVKKIFGYLAIVVLSFLASLNYVILVFPNRFAPAGVDGVCTMIQDVTQINMGYLALLVNVPLILAAFLVLNREFAVKSTVFVVFFSLFTVLLRDKMDLSAFLFLTETGSSTVLAPIAGGALRGVLYVGTLALNGSAGGIDIISALIKQKRPHLDLMNIIFCINMTISASSYFVYGRGLEPVICSIVYAFVTSFVCSHLRASKKERLRYEILTEEGERLSEEIGEKLDLRPTVLPAAGGEVARFLVVCVLPKEKSPFLEELLRGRGELSVFKSVVQGATDGVTYK